MNALPLRLPPGSDIRGALKKALSDNGSCAGWGGHVLAGCIVRTRAELMLALLPQWHFRREIDPATGYAELVARPAGD